jgi:sirohydrochlorin ferrochelatase
MGMAQQEDESKVPLDIKFYRKLVQIRRGADIENILREMALAYSVVPSDENSKVLTVCAEEAGYTRDEILQWINEDRLVPLGNNATTLDKAMDFLKRMMESGKEYESITITEKAEVEGFTLATLNAAKRQLSIRSERRAKCWVWIRP